MPEHNNTNEAQNTVDDTTVSTSKVWERRIAMFFIMVASVGLVICVGLLIQAHITHKPVFELLKYDSFKPNFELLGYNSFVFLIAGYLVLTIASSISLIVSKKRKQLSYTSAIIGAVLMFLSFWLSFISRKPDLEWWGYSSRLFMGTGVFTMTLSTLVDIEQKRLQSMLQLIAFFLMFVASILMFLVTIYGDTMPAS